MMETSSSNNEIQITSVDSNSNSTIDFSTPFSANSGVDLSKLDFSELPADGRLWKSGITGKGPGRRAWEPTEENLKLIKKCSAMGMRLFDIAATVGLGYNTFIQKKTEFPIIQDVIDEGRKEGRMALLETSWDIIKNIKDPARNQELSRLNRLLKTEQADIVTPIDQKAAIGGFRIEIIPKNSGNTEIVLNSKGTDSNNTSNVASSS